MRRLAFLTLVLSVFVAVPKSAEAQFTAAYIVTPTPNSEYSVLAGPSLSLYRWGRFQTALGIMAGIVADKADPLYRDDMHWHLGLMPNLSATVYLTNRFGATVGYGRTLVFLSDAKTHLQDSNSWFIGATFGR